MRWREGWKKIEARVASPQPSLDPLHPLGSSPLKRGQLGATGIAEGLSKLMSFRGPDGRYLVTRKVHWQAIFRILVDRGIYPDGTDYRGFCCYMEEVFPTAEWRVPLDYHSLKNISQTMFVRPFVEWRYDAVYNIKFKSYHQMYRIAALLDEQLSENLTRR